MKILLTNDDGYNATGILALLKTLKKEHEVVLVAPDREKSAVGHGITLNDPIRMEKVKTGGHEMSYSVTGTPVDCIKLALAKLFPSPPDLVVSGINPGSNAGININYSGTAGAAREAALNGIPAMAVSIFKGNRPLDFTGVSGFVLKMAGKIRELNLAHGTFLNINVPDIPVDEIDEIRVTRQAAKNLAENFEERKDPKQRPYYWYGHLGKSSAEPGTDEHALSRNIISITPIQCDMTDHEARKRLCPVFNT